MKQFERKYFFGPDGRKLLIKEWGPLDKPVILLVHGFPGCADHGQLVSTSPLWDSFRLIAMDRPGYGESDLQEDLTPLKFAQQMVEFLDQQNISRLSILSVSGGAPYAMAAAYLLKDRVHRMASLAGVAPLTVKNFRFMNSQQKKAWAMINFVPDTVLRFALGKVWDNGGIDKLEQMLFTEMDSFSEADQKIFADPELGPVLIETTKAALQQGPRGILHDLKVYNSHWGFPLKQIQCPVTLWHGSSDDVVHPRFAEDMRKRLPTSELKIISNEGHYSLPANCRDQILTDLLA